MTPTRFGARGLALMLMAVPCAPSRAVALEQNDTMQTWRAGSEADRAHLLDDLRARNSKLRRLDRSALLACLNAAASIDGHSALRIGDVAEACSEPPSTGNGDQQSDI